MADQKCLQKRREWFFLAAECWCEQEWDSTVTGEGGGALGELLEVLLEGLEGQNGVRSSQ